MSELLEISVLGSPSIRRGSTLISGLGWKKAEALLYYLVCNRQPYSRQSLASLLWDEESEADGLHNLRMLLNRLRQQLASHLVINRQTLAFNEAEPFWLDLMEMEKLFEVRSHERLDAQDVAKLEQGLVLYKDEFLKGFYLRESAGFEEWVVTEQERLNRLMVEVLYKVVQYHLEHQQWQQGLKQVTRLLQLDRLQEKAQRQMLRLLVFNGQRSVALDHYKGYQEYLDQELGIEPELKTTELYERIQSGQLGNIAEDQVITGVSSINNNQKIGASLLLDRAAQLQKIGLFEDIPIETLIEVAGLLNEINVREGRTIFEQGDTGRCMYIITSGQVRLYDEKRASDLTVHDIFGEMAILDETPHLISAKALEDSCLLRLDQDALYNLMTTRIEVVRGILQVLSSRLRERVRNLVEHGQPQLAGINNQQST